MNEFAKCIPGLLTNSSFTGFYHLDDTKLFSNIIARFK